MRCCQETMSHRVDTLCRLAEQQYIRRGSTKYNADIRCLSSEIYLLEKVVNLWIF